MGIRSLTLSVVTGINRITDLQDPASPLALISSWKMFIPFLLSQRACQCVMEAKLHGRKIPSDPIKEEDEYGSTQSQREGD